MSLIFDRYPRTPPRVHGRGTGSGADAQAADPFPGQFEPPIVHVERAEALETEERIVAIAERFGGTFAGT